nr:sterile alpha motif domain-containing protein 3 isoform X1 [Pongo pygmaeus]XP_054348679.1 sterile alpha motif domain-containing protein 3 isoform X1 [Pongo pygmaeus]XP_054348680.1 sterile alpha motif domain-containing protein 3 isoform X1 [Pongo pygmaeus]XP_054348681.1 sterile alpha motif domain-containing protein 3 isoform X1 [Pongo pygmaeus]XP_054348683.1 sterile alpha motif domain-containing protein 3 isoform X1 [Pongo pygmaeus]XP_054348684.1 sterile alpha motif domain-containing protein
METWSVEQVCSWLVEKNLGELVHRFQEEEVSGAALLALNDRMVQQLVKKIGHQAVLMNLIKKYKQNTQGLKSPENPKEAALVMQTEAARDYRDEESSSPANHGEQMPSFYPAENLDNGLIDQRVLKQRWGRNVKHILARSKALQWTKSYVLPEFPYDVKCMLAEQKCPDHSMRIRIIEFLQADMTKYLEGSLYPSTQQYNDVVNALLQAHPFLDEDGCGFFLWKRALKDRFKYVRRPIEDDEQVIRNKCKFGHRRGQTRKSLADIRFDEIKLVQIKEEAVCFDSELDGHIKWFQQEYVKTEKDWREIDKRMSQTLEIRRKMIGSRTPLKDILKLFPFLKCPYQMFREFQLLTRTDIYKKTRHILESYSENILTSFSVVDNPINIVLQEKMKHYTDEDMLKYMKMTATCLLLPDVFGDDPSLFVIMNEQVQVSTPVLEVKNPFNMEVCEFSLYLERERLTKLDDCVTALAALVAAFHVFGIECPRRLSQTFNFLETLIFDMHSPYFPSLKEKENEVGFQHPVT